MGSIAGGGRYDGLVESFAKGHRVPCCGVSLGIERIFSLMEAKARRSGAADRTTSTQVFVASAHKGLVEARLSMARELWEGGLRAEMPYKNNPKLLDQLQFCEDRGIPIALILGDDELKRGIVKVRVIATREELEVPRDHLISQLKQRLGTD